MNFYMKLRKNNKQNLAIFITLAQYCVDTFKIFFSFCRRGPGQEYLKSTLGALVRHVVDQDHLQLEINPLKVWACDLS